MSLVISTEYTHATAPNADYPQGSFKNVSTPAGIDGTPLEKAWPNDLYGFFQRLLLDSGITPSGVPDTVLASDYFNALQNLLLKKGSLERPKFIYKDADEVYLNAGSYHHDGTKEQCVSWNSQLTVQLTGAAASTWYYLYIDDSAIVTAGSNLLTASEFIFSSTAPTWSDAKHGWYNGQDRCIFAALTDGSNNILEFFHNGERCLFADQIIEIQAWDVDTAWLDRILTAPSFTTQIEATLRSRGLTGALPYWRTKGQAGTVGHLYGVAGANSQDSWNNVSVITDSNQTIQFKYSLSDASTLDVFTEGWYFPEGM